jgi:hypothetical protein
MTINFKDPRFQRMLQQSNARALYGNRPRTDKISALFARQQLEKDLAFQRLGIRSKFMESQHELDLARAKLRDKALDLQAGGLELRSARLDIAEDRLEDRKDALPLTIGLGVGTAGLAALEGRRRYHKTQELQQEEARRHDDLLKIMSTRYKIPTTPLRSSFSFRPTTKAYIK